jgi:hypothetical protein
LQAHADVNCDFCDAPLCEPCWPQHEPRCATAQAAVVAGMMAAGLEMGMREAADERDIEEEETMSEGEGGEEDELEDVFLEDDGEMEDRRIEEMGDEDEKAREDEDQGEMEEDTGGEDYCAKCEEMRNLYLTECGHEMFCPNCLKEQGVCEAWLDIIFTIENWRFHKLSRRVITTETIINENVFQKRTQAIQMAGKYSLSSNSCTDYKAVDRAFCWYIRKNYITYYYS